MPPPLHVRNRGARLAASTTFVIASGNWVSLPSPLTHWWPMFSYNREMSHRNVAAHWSELTAASAFVSKRHTVSETLLFGPAAKYARSLRFSRPWRKACAPYPKPCYLVTVAPAARSGPTGAVARHGSGGRGVGPLVGDWGPASMQMRTG